MLKDDYRVEMRSVQHLGRGNYLRYKCSWRKTLWDVPVWVINHISGITLTSEQAVVLFHAGLGCGGGFVGVDVFFVISGFLITSLILKETQENGFKLAVFWERRIRRILPALLAMVWVTLVLSWFLYFPEDFSLVGKSVVAQALLASNFFFWSQSGYFTPGADTQPLLHTWSLAVVEQFYVFFPLLLVFLARHKQFPVARTIVWLAGGSLGLSVAGSYLKEGATFYLLPTRAWELLLGALIAAMPRRPQFNPRLNETLGISGLALVCYSILFYTRATRFPGLAAIPPCLGAALIIFSGSGQPTLTSRALAWKPVVFIGLISYSLYLWHWPLLVFSRYTSVETQSGSVRVALLLASVAMAMASWKWIETPFRNRSLFPRCAPVFALAGCSMLTLVLFGGGVYWSRGMPSRVSAQVNHFLSSRHDRAFLNEITLSQAAAGQFAELGAQNTNQPIEMLLWGDSHAMALAPALDELCRRYSVRVVEATHSATAPVLGYSNQGQGLQADSQTFSKSVVEFIAQKHIKVVLLGASWASYGPPDLIRDRLSETIRTVMASGAAVYLVKDVPQPGFNVPRLAAATLLRHGDLGQLRVPAGDYAAMFQRYEPIFDHLSRLGANILDGSKYFLNPNGFYDVIRNGQALYCDGNHLTVAGAKQLVPLFEPLFRKGPGVFSDP